MATKKRKGSHTDIVSEPCAEVVNDPYAVVEKCLTTSRGDTGLIIDCSSLPHASPWDENHPETPNRVVCIVERIMDLGLRERCQVFAPRKASKKEIMMCHTEDDYEALKLACTITSFAYLEDVSSQFDSIYINSETFNSAVSAAGCSIAIVDEILKGTVQNGMALVRPPGHHAMPDEYNGYCFFNNVGIAARHALKDFNLERILIVDFDVHHGQGTQQLFKDDKRVLYFSIHRYEDGTFWPNLRVSNYDYIGDTKGKGFNWNIPLNKTAMTNSDFLAILHHLLLPVSMEFEPQVVLISAGYDSAIGDEKGEMLVTPAFYSHMIWPLMQLANGKIALILEGGYCLKSLAEGAALSLRALLGDPCPDLGSVAQPCPSIIDTIFNVITTQRPFWKCLKVYPSYIVKGGSIEDGKHDVVEPQHIGTDPHCATTFPTRDCYTTQSTEVKSEIGKILNEIVKDTDLSVASEKVSLAYDDAVLKHSPVSVTQKTEFEVPKRVIQIMEDLRSRGLYQRCSHLKARVVKLEELKVVHAKQYIDVMNNLKYMGNEDIKKVADSYDSIYLCPFTVDSARAAVGGVLQVVDAVISKKCQSGIAVVRPPGHHSGSETASGFCIFNNVAVAAKYAKKKYGIKKVLIVDWDVHHGNGTQDIFKSDSDVLYISLHRYSARFFPFSAEGNFDYVGEGEGRGFTVNIPWTEAKVGDSNYIAAFHHIVLPICYEFNPELVLVSAGFDALDGDPLGGCKVTPQCLAHLTHYLMALANGKVILCLEGGYNIQATSYGMTMCVKALLGDPLPSLNTKLSLTKPACKTLHNVVSMQKKFWTSLAGNVLV